MVPLTWRLAMHRTRIVAAAITFLPLAVPGSVLAQQNCGTSARDTRSAAVGTADSGVRVGGNIPTPRRIVDVAAIYPPAARQAGVSEVVILETTLAADGTVSDARVLNGHPMLDQAAIDARQWRYETTLLNGVTVPVRFTATVNFPR
jgi:TonB family protein